MYFAMPATMAHVLALALVLAAATHAGAHAGRTHTRGTEPWMDSTLPVDERVSLLLGSLTNHEKNAQLSYGNGVVPGGSTNASKVVAAAERWGGR